MCLQAFQQEIYLNTGKIELVFRQGDALIEKSEPLDAAVIEEELEELQRYCQEVFGRVDRYYKKLTRLPVSRDHCNQKPTQNTGIQELGAWTASQSSFRIAKQLQGTNKSCFKRLNKKDLNEKIFTI